MNRISSFFVRLWMGFVAFWKARSITTRVLLVCLSVILVAVCLSLSRSFKTAPKAIEKRLYGEEIGREGLRYKHGAHIYNPKNGEILVDSIEWLHVTRGDTIAILAKNHRRAFINLNNAQLITPLDYDKAWQFSCDRGIMSRHDSLFIFRRDGSQVNVTGLSSRNQYEYLFYNNTLVLNVDYKHVGLLDTAGNWVLEPIYSMVETNYNKRLYNTKLGDECIVYDFDLKPILRALIKTLR